MLLGSCPADSMPVLTTCKYWIKEVNEGRVLEVYISERNLVSSSITDTDGLTKFPSEVMSTPIA